MKALRNMVVANLKMSYRNRTALFWNLAFPLIFIVLFQFLFSDDSVSIDVGIVGADTSSVSQEVASEMRGADGFNVSTGSEESELDALTDGDRSVVVVFAPGSNGSEIDARLYWDETDPQLGQIALGAVNQFLSDVNAGMTNGAPVISVATEAVESTEIDYMDFLIPGILAMSIMNTGMIGLASAFVTYRERGILRRIRATPFPLSSFILARILSQLVVSVAQAVILITAGILIANLTINGNMLYVMIMVTLGSLAFLSLGFVVAAFARNQETADSTRQRVHLPDALPRRRLLSGRFSAGVAPADHETDPVALSCRRSPKPDDPQLDTDGRVGERFCDAHDRRRRFRAGAPLLPLGIEQNLERLGLRHSRA